MSKSVNITIMVALSEFDCDKCQAISQYRRKATCITNNSMDEKDKSNIYVDQYGKRIKRKITQKQKILSDTEIACVVTEYQNGASTYDLACKYGCHRNTIICHLRKNGFKVSNGKINSEQSAEIAELYKSGVSSITIAKRLSISQSTVLNHLHLQGVEVRKGRPCHTTI